MKVIWSPHDHRMGFIAAVRSNISRSSSSSYCVLGLSRGALCQSCRQAWVEIQKPPFFGEGSRNALGMNTHGTYERSSLLPCLGTGASPAAPELLHYVVWEPYLCIRLSTIYNTGTHTKQKVWMILYVPYSWSWQWLTLGQTSISDRKLRFAMVVTRSVWYDAGIFWKRNF